MQARLAKVRDVAIDRASALRNAEKLVRLGKVDAALAEYRRVVEDQPQDWNTANMLGDLYLRAGQPEKAVEQFVRIADNLTGQGFLPTAAALYKKILKIRPDHEHAMLRVGEIAATQGVLVDARTFLTAVVEKRRASGDEAGAAAVRRHLFEAHVGAGDLDRAREFAVTPELRSALGQALIARGNAAAAAELLAADGADADPQLLLAFAQHALAAGAVDDGLIAVRRVLNLDARRTPDVEELGWRLAESIPELGLRVIEIVAEMAIIEGDWRRAAAVLEKFIAIAPAHIAALRRLVEISVDGALETTMSLAQSRLADAYLATGAALDARAIVEDLLAREPRLPVHVDRLRRALVMLGEPDPERVIAEQLGVTFEQPEPVDVGGADASARTRGDSGGDPSAGGASEASQTGLALQGDADIDLSDMLADLSVGDASDPLPPARDLEEVFGRFREEALGTRPEARAAYQRGVELRERGCFDESVSAFEAACRDDRWRFQAASAIAHVYKERQQVPQAVEWLERAAEAQSPGPEETHAVFYELADTLESIGEVERALAVCLELQADAGEYRDLSERIKRLTRVGPEG